MSVVKTLQKIRAQRPRLLFGQSEIQTITILALGDVVGIISYIKVTDIATVTTYDVYPEGAQAYCTPGAGNLGLLFRVENTGALDGDIRILITDDTGAVLYDVTWTLIAGGGATGPVSVTLDMPGRDYGITIEVTP